MSVKLNLGCGKEHKDGHINIDIQEPCDLKHDLRTPLPFTDGSVDRILCEDFVTHLSREEWKNLKKEMARVLKGGGEMEIIFLDFQHILKGFLDNPDLKSRDWWMRTIFSAQEDEHDFAKNGFTYEKMVVDLCEEGLQNFSKEPSPSPEHIRLICQKQPDGPQKKTVMKILIGTPVNQSKDYCVEKWLKNVSNFEYPTDILFVDTSPGPEYVEKMKGYCEKYGIKNYKIEHLEISQHQPWAEKIGRSWEVIRREVLSNNYDAWFSLACDLIIPTDALNRLAIMMEGGGYMMIGPNSWSRERASEPGVTLDCALVKRVCLEKYGFLLEYPGMPNCWAQSGAWFKKRIIMGGGSYIEIFGAISPIQRLKDQDVQSLG